MAGEDALVVNDDGFDDLIDMGLAGHRILPIWNVHQSGPKADGQVVGIHHVLITVLRQAASTSVREVRRRLSPFPQKNLPPTSLHCPRKAIITELYIFPENTAMARQG